MSVLVIDSVPDTGDQPLQMLFLEFPQEPEILVCLQQLLHYLYELVPVGSFVVCVFHLT